ncbi:MAG: PQQ-dependent sugar dehydrogenase [Dokdonella sp.]
MSRRILIGSMFLLACVSAFAQNLPSGFQRTDPIAGRNLPTGVYFAHDGRVFVTEKGGQIWLYPNLLAAPTLFFDLSVKIHTVGDRGLLGFALDPHFPEVPAVYVLYAYNGGLFPDSDPVPWAPRWTTNCGSGAGQTEPTPQPTQQGGCVVSGHLSRLDVSGNVATAETVLIEDWYQWYPSHSIGTLLFGDDGYLYVGGGDGASYNWADWGQGVGNTTYPDTHSPALQGGALRSQALEIQNQYTTGDIRLNGAILRVDPATGAGAPGNPLAGDASPNAQRILAYGLRNPFRFTKRPDTGEIWVGDVGWNTWEEINRIPAPPATGNATLTNFGWPCFEGRVHTGGYSGANLALCNAMYANGDTGGRTPWSPPWYTYVHQGSSDITGLAFYTGSTYPAQYHDSLFFADNSRTIIFNIPYADANADGIPDPPPDSSATAFFGGSLATAVQLTSGPGGDIFFTNINTGKISRLAYCSGCSSSTPGNVAPSAAIALDIGSSAAGPPRTIGFSAANSVDPNSGDTLSYAWDLDGDGNFNDATGLTASAFFGANGPHSVAVQVSDNHGGVDIAQMSVSVGNTAPSVTITSPTAGSTWSVGETIALTATSSDPEQGSLPDSALNWQIYQEDCANADFTNCIETALGSSSGSSSSFVAPDTSFPAYLRILLTGTDDGDLTATQELSIYPATAAVALETAPSGLSLGFDGTTLPTPQSHTVILNQSFEVSAAATQSLAGTQYQFADWSDAGDATHTVHIATSGTTTLTATYAATADIAVGIDDGLGTIGTGQRVTWTLSVENAGVNGLAGVLVHAGLPNTLTNVQWTCTATGASSCSASGSGAPDDSATLASGGQVTYLISATVAANAGGSITVSASATIPGGYVNQSPANDSASDTDAVSSDLIFRDGFELP